MIESSDRQADGLDDILLRPDVEKITHAHEAVEDWRSLDMRPEDPFSGIAGSARLQEAGGYISIGADRDLVDDVIAGAVVGIADGAAPDRRICIELAEVVPVE